MSDDNGHAHLPGIPPQQEREMHELHAIHDSGPAKARAVLWTRILIVCAVIFSVFIAGLQLYTTALVRQTQVANTDRAKDTQDLAEQIRSCTSPGGKCYERGQKQTAKAVGAIGVVNRKSAAAAATCAQTRTEYAEILRCINRTLGIQHPR